MTDGELVLAIRAGDQDAWNELVRRHSHRLWALARAQGLEAHAANDVVQTVWLALVDHRDRIRDPDAVGGWLSQVAKREAWRLARLGRKSIPTIDGGGEAARFGSDHVDLVDGAIRSETMREVWAAVGQLSAECVELLRLKFGGGDPSQRELAAKLNMPVGSIGPTLGRCIEKARRILNTAHIATAQRKVGP